jgi:hypothetical protein
MSKSEKLENHSTKGRPVRRVYLFYVFAGPAIVGLLGAFLVAIAIFSTQPVPVRVTELPVGALMLIVAVFMPRMSGPLEFSLFRSSFKANLDATLSEALLLAREAAVEVQGPDDPKKEEKAEEAVERVLRLYSQRLWDAGDRTRDEYVHLLNRLIWSEHDERRSRGPQGLAADRPDGEGDKSVGEGQAKR